MAKRQKNQIVPFNEDRWNNWIELAKESDYKNIEEAPPPVFIDMEEDVIIACYKLIKGFEIGQVTKEETLESFAKIELITQKKINTGDEDLDDILDLVQSSLLGAFASFESYVTNSFVDDVKADDLIKEAVEQEKKGNLDRALEIVGKIGAKIMAGNSLSEEAVVELNDGCVAEWLDGIESISAVLISNIEYDDGSAEDE
ncbi:MAG TPA: DUF2150 family protein [Candidatus Acidoferrales bacterium]|nr:DUF2150 family protein [Candidatus Acidoferrales bacterium]